MKNSQIKILTKGIINGYVGKSFLLLLAGILILLVFTAIPVAINYLTVNPIISLVGVSLSLLLSAFLWSAFCSGSSAWFCFYKRKSRTKNVLFWFAPKRAAKSFVFYSILFFMKLFWTILTLSPGVITIFSFVFLAYDAGLEFNLFLCGISGGIILLLTGVAFRFVIVQKYFLAKNIFVSDPRITAAEAIRKSCEGMNGKLKKAALFKLSFAPWFLLCIGVLPAVYVWPYYRQSCALLAGEINK